MTAVNSLIVNEVLRVHGPDAQRLGLDRLDEDALILGSSSTPCRRKLFIPGWLQF